MTTRVKIVFVESKEGAINKEIIGWLARELENYSFKTEYDSKPILTIPPKDFKLDFNTLVKELKTLLGEEVKENKKILCITDFNLKDERYNSFVGKAEMAYAIVSTARLSCNDIELFKNRILKESLHELGHTLGLDDHEDTENFDCVMNYSHTVDDIDVKNKTYCPTCRRKLERKKNPFAVILIGDVRDIIESRFISGLGFFVLLVGSLIYGCLLIVYFLLNMAAGDTWLGLLGYIILYFVTVSMIGISYGTVRRMSRKIYNKSELNYDDDDLRFFLKMINWMRFATFTGFVLLIPLTLTFFTIWLAFKFNSIESLSLFGRTINQSGFLTLFPSWFFSASTILGLCAFIFLFVAYNRFTVTSYLPGLIDRFYNKIVTLKRKKGLHQNSSQDEIDEALSEIYNMHDEITGMLPRIAYDCAKSEEGPWNKAWWEKLENKSKIAILTSESLILYWNGCKDKSLLRGLPSFNKDESDYSFWSLGYCKALEIELYEKIINKANKKHMEKNRIGSVFACLRDLGKMYNNNKDEDIKNFFKNNLKTLQCCFKFEKNGMIKRKNEFTVFFSCSLWEIYKRRNGLAHTTVMKAANAKELNGMICEFFDNFFKSCNVN